jgi:hypothetical protein
MHSRFGVTHAAFPLPEPQLAEVEEDASWPLQTAILNVKASVPQVFLASLS